MCGQKLRQRLRDRDVAVAGDIRKSPDSVGHRDAALRQPDVGPLEARRLAPAQSGVEQQAVERPPRYGDGPLEGLNLIGRQPPLPTTRLALLGHCGTGDRDSPLRLAPSEEGGQGAEVTVDSRRRCAPLAPTGTCDGVPTLG